MENSYTFEDLVNIIAQLRSDHGCPWDREQTHGSLKKCMRDEVEEVCEGIDLYERTGDGDNLCEELGDVLMNVLLQCQIAKEEGIFTLEDVIQGISKKMIRRHPHVFGNGTASTSGEVLLTWEEIKKLEKEGKI
ncbi:MAG: MazG nucleotide pyrophosphohydrolase domain-containing protein [Lachnospiraceae bacterium]|nr:MazG nucleotide pyrophosphohydrolase domain-containing protein [Lachnospiraceae bacterium]